MIIRKDLLVVAASLALIGAQCSTPSEPYNCDNPPAFTGLVKVKEPWSKVSKTAEEHLVMLRPKMITAATRVQARASALAIAQKLGISGARSLRHGFIGKLDAQRLAAALASPDVAFIQQNGTKRINATPPKGVDRSDQRKLPLDWKYEPNRPAMGEGAHACIIDTGLDATHPDFRGRIGECHAASGLPDCKDGHGHGTHVAGTVAGTEYGLSRLSTIHWCRALNSDGSGSDAQVIECVDWCIELAEDLGVDMGINLSLGGGPAPALDDAICRAAKAGVFVSIAAGNDGSDACGGSPARVESAGTLTVGATEILSTGIQDSLTSWSNRGRCVDILAPGADIESAKPGGGSQTMSGTSMAAPHVLGGLLLAWAENLDAQMNAMVTGLLVASTPDIVQGVPEQTSNRLLFVKKE